MSGQKFEYLKNEQSFYDKIKAFFIILNGFNWNKTEFFERQESDFKDTHREKAP